VGVLVTDILPPSPRKLARMASRALRGLHRRLPRIPWAQFGEGDFEFVRSQLGAGYGTATEAARAAVSQAAGHGLRLETTYTGKCLAALIERTRARPPAGPVLFWNTFNAVDVERSAPAPLDPAALPRSLRRFLTRPPAD
jgi:hypothetical protein